MYKILITLGIVLIIVGIWMRLDLPFPLGKLPGDIVIKREGFTFYFPITSSIVVSIILSLLFRLMR